MEDERFDQCMERLKAGDKDALHEIYTACGPYIYHFILGIVKSREDAEDVTSEFFIRLWKSADRYRPGSGHKTYLMTIARNMAIDLLRSKGRESLIEDIFPQNGEDPDVYTTEERVVADQGGTGAMLSDEDAGIPGDPDVTASAEERGVGGLGVYMVKKSMDDVSYEYRDGQNILRIRKNL